MNCKICLSSGFYLGVKSTTGSRNAKLLYLLKLYLPSMLIELVRLLWLIDVFVSCEMWAKDNYRFFVLSCTSNGKELGMRILSRLIWSHSIIKCRGSSLTNIIVRTIFPCRFYEVLNYLILCIWIPNSIINNWSSNTFKLTWTQGEMKDDTRITYLKDLVILNSKLQPCVDKGSAWNLDNTPLPWDKLLLDCKANF